jgi:hypothetical protein
MFDNRPDPCSEQRIDWKYHRDLGQRFEREVCGVTGSVEKSRYYWLAADSYVRAAGLAPYDLRHILSSAAARCYDTAALLRAEVA